MADILRIMRGDETYIWQLPSWPHLTWDATRLVAPLAEVRFRQGRSVGRMQGLDEALLPQAELVIGTEDARATAAIEGELLTQEDVRSSVAHHLGITEEVTTTPSRQVDGLVRVLFDATEQYDQPLTLERLCTWHAWLLPERSDIQTGAVRTDESGPMEVVSGPMGKETVHFEAPPAADGYLVRELGRFLAWLEAPSQLDPVVKAAFGHLWFITLHPFDDGNGRLARAITDRMLARSEQSPRRTYSLSREIEQSRAAYYRQLEWTQKGTGDITDWLLWFISIFASALDQSERMLSGILKRASFWRSISRESLNERQLHVLERMLQDDFEGFMTSSKWARMTKVSQDTANRDIRDLVERGIMTPNEGGGRSTSYRVDV